MDEYILKQMKMDLDFMFEYPKFLKAKLESLKKTRDFWAKFKRDNQ